MAKKKNRYKSRANKKHFLSGLQDGLPTKGNAKNTALETGKDILVAVLGGGLIGAAIGKPSMVVGLATTGFGHYSGNRIVQLLGVGMMAANGFNKSNAAVSGLEGLAGVKERLQAYKESMSEKFYLDKILKKKSSGTSGVGELQYFTYPDSMNGNLAALDDIEQQIEDSARQFQGQMSGDDDLQIGLLDMDDHIM